MRIIHPALPFLTLACSTNTTDAQREDREDEIIVMVRVSLVDDDTEVRAAAAQAFDVLQLRDCSAGSQGSYECK
jgi:hypothetical protein